MNATQDVHIAHELEERLRAVIRGDVLTDEYSLGMYSTDASFYQMLPLAVVVPKDEEDVKAAVSIAAELRVNILPRGGGTSLAGQTVCNAVVLDFRSEERRVGRERGAR